jgi:serine/threonine protein kinase
MEAKDLVSKILCKEPSLRYSATEALTHPWFSCAYTKLNQLSNAQENMKKYKGDEKRFNVSSIKPEFSMVTCTPLLNSRFEGKDSPLLMSTDKQKRTDYLIPGKLEDHKLNSNGGIIIRDITQRFNRVVVNEVINREVKVKKSMEEGNLDENEINENPGIASCSSCSSVAGEIPTSGFVPSKSLIHMRHLAIPIDKRRLLSTPGNKNKAECYFQRGISFGKELTKENRLRSKTITNDYYTSLQTKPNNNPMMKGISQFKTNKEITKPKEVKAVQESSIRRASCDVESIASELQSNKESSIAVSINFDQFVTAMSHQSSSQAFDIESLSSCRHLGAEDV